MIAALLWWVGVAEAGSSQQAFEVERAEHAWHYSYRWRDGDDALQRVSFELPAAAVLADREEVTWLPRKELNRHAAAAVRAWGETVPDVQITARVEGGGVQIRASGPRGSTRPALAAAAEVRDEAVDDWLAEHDFTRMADGSITFDHAGLVAAYSDELAPVAAALRADAPSDRAFVSRALSFVQSIPYEARKRRGGDPGYRRPLALLARNRGDCDSKTVLFLGIVHAALPDVPLAVIYVPDHALGGVGLPPEPGDQSFRVRGTRFLYVEPVGPALHPLGTPAPEDRRAGKRGEVHVVEASLGG